MFRILLIFSILILSLSIVFTMYRVIIGPSLPDRIIAMDCIGINLLAIMAILSILLRTYAFFDVILLFGILSFIGTVAFSRFIERRALVDYDRNK
ncbi:MAG: Na(+)/H(+) antiporter subunit F1 [Clostridia bacterium]|jgi:multicomponent Na+:H+ antiporter subunit F|nr:Na(+)/H(+) antiporter subunit F1 [Clostridia bacterium]